MLLLDLRQVLELGHQQLLGYILLLDLLLLLVQELLHLLVLTLLHVWQLDSALERQPFFD
jgi:hypothetical protein